jgi:thiol-disulfide isomerase/thioredoxin
MTEERLMRLALLLLGMFTAMTTLADPVDFTLNDTNGKPRSLSEFRGKWVIVNYWATWCPPCLDEIPDLVEFHDRHKDKDAVVLGINFEEVDPEYLHEFVDTHFMTYPVLSMDPVSVTPLGPVLGLPTTYIISPEGERVARQEGPISGEAIEAFLERKRQLRGSQPTSAPTSLTAAAH